MFNVRPHCDEFHVVETYPNGAEMVVARLSNEFLARQWLETYLRLHNINGLGSET
jgi:hypothetical protein